MNDVLKLSCLERHHNNPMESHHDLLVSILRYALVDLALVVRKKLGHELDMGPVYMNLNKN